MSKKFIKHPRKTVAMALVGLGLAGVSVASASSLVVNGDDSNLVQAGSDDKTISTCQTTAIDVSVGLDDGNGNGAGHLNHGTGDVDDFGYVAADDVVILDAIDQACEGRTVKVAFGGQQGELLAEYEGLVPDDGGVLTLPIASFQLHPGFFAPGAATAKVSVTILD